MSFCEEIRRAVMASPRMKLPEIRSAMYKAFTAGQITETEAETLDALINARAAILSGPVSINTTGRSRAVETLEVNNQLEPEAAAGYPGGFGVSLLERQSRIRG